MGTKLNENGDYSREERLMRLDDRGVFGSESLSIPAGLRRRFQLVTEPARAKAWQLLNGGHLDEAERIFHESLPRHQEDCEDSRYFGIYWGMAEVAMRRDDKIAALDWFQQGIAKFPTAVRKNHLRKLIQLGVRLSKELEDRGDQLSEADAAAILARIGETLERWTKADVAPLEDMELHSARSKLEVQSPLGRFAASRRHRT